MNSIKEVSRCACQLKKSLGGGIRKGGGSEVFFLLGWDRMVSRGDGGGVSRR